MSAASDEKRLVAFASWYCNQPRRVPAYPTEIDPLVIRRLKKVCIDHVRADNGERPLTHIKEIDAHSDAFSDHVGQTHLQNDDMHVPFPVALQFGKSNLCDCCVNLILNPDGTYFITLHD